MEKNKISENILKLFIFHKGRMNAVECGFLFMALVFASQSGFYFFNLKITFLIPSIVLLILGYSTVCALTKRFRDIGFSGWWNVPFLIVYITFSSFSEPIIHSLGNHFTGYSHILISLILILFPWTPLILSLWPPEKKDNKYGPYEPHTFLGFTLPQSLR